MECHILNLGAGVQSTTLYLMFMQGVLTPQIDYAIFADTGEEPEAVYRHLAWLQSLNGPEILVRSKGKLGDHLLTGQDSTGQRFASIPAYTLRPDGTEGKVRRQCSSEYKIEVIERCIRREILGLQAGRRVPKSITLTQYIGISLDEAGRARRIDENHRKNRSAVHRQVSPDRAIHDPGELPGVADPIRQRATRDAPIRLRVLSVPLRLRMGPDQAGRRGGLGAIRRD